MRKVVKAEVSILMVTVIGFVTQSGCAKYSESSRMTSPSGVTAEVGSVSTYAFGSDSEVVTLVSPRTGQKVGVFRSECNGSDPIGVQWKTKDRLEITCDGIEFDELCGDRSFTMDGNKVVVTVKCP